MTGKNQNPNAVYFPSLDGLRFFAFFSVFLHHSLYYIDSSNPIIKYFLIIFQKNGWVGLDLFFILSGFLITYLLLQEKKTTGSISLKNFWIRRSLRIWPLYFLALLFGFFIYPLTVDFFNNEKAFLFDELKRQLLYYVFFLGNWAVIHYDYSSFKNISHLWSISIEEQFYVLWPLIVVFLATFKRLVIGSILLIIISLGTRIFLIFNNTQHPDLYTNSFARMDTLIIGSLLAIIYFYRPSIFNFFQKRIFIYLTILLLGIFSYYLYRIAFFNTYAIRNSIFGYTVTSVFLSFFVITALHTPKISTFFANKYFVWMGKISFGLYVWHILAIELVFRILGPLGLQNWRFIPSFLLTILFGYISYHFYEKKFLQYKKKFSSVHSRPV